MDAVVDLGHDIVATSMRDRGLHLFDPNSMGWRPPTLRPVLGQAPVPPEHDDRPRDPTYVEHKNLVYPLPGDDRFPITIVKFPPRFVMGRHWHTEGEFIYVLRGSMLLAGRPSGPGTMAYNDARTVYGAEAAGDEGCEFLMIRRAWAETHVVTPESPPVPHDVLDTGREIIATTRADRGLHIFHADSMPWRPPVVRPVRGQAPLLPDDDHRPSDPTHPQERCLMYPLPGEDRFPIIIVKFPPHYSFGRHWHTDGEFVMILGGSANFAGRELGPGAMAYNDARTVYGAESAGPDGCEFLLIRRAWAETSMVESA